ncbi:MAG: Mrp/NBP35 family ATP-binding protein [Clostridia bacterium]|nr:Mrp/NBP35 family ATP-binding protein [Clostridia bacterium]
MSDCGSSCGSSCGSGCGDSCGSSCGEGCGGSQEQQSFQVAPNQSSQIKKVIGVVSGKGGVGKSLVTSLLAIKMKQKGLESAVLDADITGPSIPRIFGIKQKADANEQGLLPIYSKTGIKLMSINLLVPDETDPVIWRGPILADAVKQFWADVLWGQVDYMFVDMPPGTGDVPLTVFQSLPLDGIIVVTSPQELVSIIVAKAVKMAGIMQVPVLGIVENMSYLKCPDCGQEIKVFGDSHLEETADKFGLRILGRLPIDPALAEACDKGNLENLEGDWLKDAANTLEP